MTIENNYLQQQSRVTLVMTGASGAPYGLRLLELLVKAGEGVDLLISDPGRIVLKMEADLSLPARPREVAEYFTRHFQAQAGQIRCYGKDQWTAPMASGSGAGRAMVVCPCTTGTLSSIACGSSRDLIERAADVVLKERRQLILVVRETPLSEIHLDNMLKLSRMGVIILPANPGFYHQPQGLQDLVDFVVARILDQLGVVHDLVPRWGADDT